LSPFEPIALRGEPIPPREMMRFVSPGCRRSLLAGMLSLAAACPARAQTATQHFPSNEDLRHTRDIQDARLSPDGHQVLLTIADPTVDGGKSHLWILDYWSPINPWRSVQMIDTRHNHSSFQDHVWSSPALRHKM
jgi:hypothetical protein